jgi:tricorn protease
VVLGDQRILALPAPAGNYVGLETVKDALLFLERGEDGPAALKSFDFEERKVKELLRGVASFRTSADGKHLLVNAGGAWSITDAQGKGEKRLDVDGIRVRVEPEAEWSQTLREVWRIQRDYFYDPKMHGVDWDAMWTRWSPFLAHVHHRADLNLVIGDLIGELSCGHEYVSGGEMPSTPASIGIGLLGADFEVADGRFRIVRILRGQNWNPGLRAPLTEPGVDAKVGDYLISVDGREVKADREFFVAFENTADHQVELGLSSKPTGGDVRKVTVVPIGSDGELRRRDWIERNRAYVTEASKGRLAYVYMPDTGPAGMAAFDRDFYAQLDKQGLVLDERYNAGGKIADYVISVLTRKVICYWRTRDASWLGRTPFATLEGPKVMLINERAGSGGDAMPWMFRQLGVGTLVGVRTWGGLVGISGYPELMDGGSVTSAAFGIQDTDGNWVVENVGVAPDIEVVETPKDFAAGRDAQLEAAVATALEALEKNPPKTPPCYQCPTPR